MPLDTVIASLARLGAGDRMPALFLGHGSPFSAIRPDEYTGSWSRIGRALPRPRAVLMVSAHWLTRGGVLITGNERPRMNYDMYGFPEEMYRLRYPATGDPSLAREVMALIEDRTPVRLDTGWGYDHGTWLPLMYMFPDADVPLIQISIDYGQPPAFHYALAAGLRTLRYRGVLLLGSGNMTHNLRRRRGPGSPPEDWAIEFDSSISRFIEEGDDSSVVNFLDLGPVARTAHPTHDHFLPLLYVLGAREDGEAVLPFNESFQEPSVSMKSFVVVGSRN